MKKNEGKNNLKKYEWSQPTKKSREETNQSVIYSPIKATAWKKGFDAKYRGLIGETEVTP